MQKYQISNLRKLIMADSVGIPPVIDTLGVKLDSLQLSSNNNDPTLFDKQNKLQLQSSPIEKDESTADETTTLEMSPGASSLEFSCKEEEEESDDDEVSIQSHHTMDSTRLLLRQCQQRLHHQSVYEEVKTLREELSQQKRTAEVAMKQKQDLANTCKTLEHELSQALDTIQSYKQKELRWYEEGAEREKEFMNQLNDMYSSMEGKERDLMEEIIKRDQKIIELQNMWNEEEIRRMKMARDKKESDDVVVSLSLPIEQPREEIHLDEDDYQSEECEFI